MYVHLNNVLIVIVVLHQVFTELQEIGKDIKEEVQDIGSHAHGDMGGDINKCPYYAAKMGELLATLYFLKYIVILCKFKMFCSLHSTAPLIFCLAVSGNTTYACDFAKMLLRQSTVQVILATWVAAVAGLAAWYLM